MMILGLDYQAFWALAIAVGGALMITGLIILAAGVSALNKIAEVLEAINGFLKRIERIMNRGYPDDVRPHAMRPNKEI